MNSLFASIKKAYQGIRALITVIGDLNKQYQALLLRINARPPLPCPSPTHPYWLDDPPFPSLTNIQSPVLPARADVLIIGSGITGAAVARSVLSDVGDDAGDVSVVVLEARELCSGATGRNGGHIKASPHETFPRLRKTLAPERAAELVRFQLKHLDVLMGVCEEEGISVAECRRVETVDVFLDAEAMETARSQVDELKKWVPEVEMKVWDAAGAREVSTLTSLHPICGLRTRVLTNL